MSRATRAEDTDEELRRAFQVFDRDNSGTISTDELRDVLKSIGENLTDAELDEMMTQVDVDGNGTIDCKYSPCSKGFKAEEHTSNSRRISRPYERFWIVRKLPLFGHVLSSSEIR